MRTACCGPLETADYLASSVVEAMSDGSKVTISGFTQRHRCCCCLVSQHQPTMDIDSDIDARLSAAAGQGQRERVEGYLSLLAELLTTKPVPVQALVKFGQHFTTSTTMAMVVGSRVLDALVTALCAGLQLEVDINDNGDKDKWTQLGKQAFAGE